MFELSDGTLINLAFVEAITPTGKIGSKGKFGWQVILTSGSAFPGVFDTEAAAKKARDKLSAAMGKV